MSPDDRPLRLHPIHRAWRFGIKFDGEGTERNAADMKTPTEDRNADRIAPPRKLVAGPLSTESALRSSSKSSSSSCSWAVVPTVASLGHLARANALSLPAWFGSAKACAVLRLKARAFVLISDARGVQRVATLDELAAAPPSRDLVGSSRPLGPAVTETTPLVEVLRVMDGAGIAHAPLVMGGVVVGVVSRDMAERAVSAGPGRTPVSQIERTPASAEERLAA